MAHCDVAYQRVLHALMLQLLRRAEQTMERRGKQVEKERLHLVATGATFKQLHENNSYLFLSTFILQNQKQMSSGYAWKRHVLEVYNAVSS